MKNEYKVLIGILLLAAFLRLPNLDTAYFGDESYWPDMVDYQLQNGFSLQMEVYKGPERAIVFWEDLPLSGMIYTAWAFLFGGSTIALRSVSLFFGLLNIVLTFVLARKVFGKRTALIAASLMAISYWHLFASYMLERDSSFLTTLYLLAFISYFNYKDSKKLTWLFITGGICSLSLFLKASGIFISGIICLWIVLDHGIQFWNYSRKTWKVVIASCATILCINSALYGSFIYITKTMFPLAYQAMFSHAVPLEYFSPSLLNAAREFVYLVLWGSPLLFGLSIYAIRAKIKNGMYLAAWFGIVLVGYLTVSYAGTLDRYLAVLLPALCMASAAVLSQLQIQRRMYVTYGLITAAVLATYNILALLPADYIAHNIGTYIAHATTLQWNFYFPFYGAGGPSFLIPFIIVVMGTLISGIVLSAAYITKKQSHLLLFIAVSLAFTLFVAQEFILHVHAPDVSESTYAAIDSAKLQFKDGDMLFTNSYGVPMYLNKSSTAFIRCREYDERCWEKANTILARKNGTFIFVDFPKYAETSRVKQTLKNCTFIESFDTLNITRTYRC